VQQKLLAETTERTGINITCSYCDIQSTKFIHWYHQLPGRSPAFIALALKGSEDLQDPPGRLSVAPDRRSSTLRLTQPRLGDAAVYYCAVG
ncbi:TVAZ2 protein, partial [Sula dactylatra]|nr:TVAZ2 protein [Sula dactylatra]